MALTEEEQGAGSHASSPDKESNRYFQCVRTASVSVPSTDDNDLATCGNGNGHVNFGDNEQREALAIVPTTIIADDGEAAFRAQQQMLHKLQKKIFARMLQTIERQANKRRQQDAKIVAAKQSVQQARRQKRKTSVAVSPHQHIIIEPTEEPQSVGNATMKHRQQLFHDLSCAEQHVQKLRQILGSLDY